MFIFPLKICLPQADETAEKGLQSMQYSRLHEQPDPDEDQGFRLLQAISLCQEHLYL